MFPGRVTNAPHIPRLRAIRDARAMTRDPIAVFETYRAELGPTFGVHFGGVRPAVVTTDPTLIEHVLRGNRHNFEKSDIQVERMVEFQGRGLVNIHGDEWMRQRKLLAQGFKPNHLAKLLPIQQDVLGELLRDFDHAVQQGPVDIHQQMVRFTLRLVGRSLFGRSMRDAELDRLGVIIEQIQEFVLRQIVHPWKIPWFRLSGQTAHYQRLRREGDVIVLQYICAWIRDGLGDTDFLRIVLETPYHDTGQTMGEPLALIETLQMLVAGNETSSNALTWVLYLLAQHPQHRADVRDEVRAVVGSGPLDYGSLHRLEQTTRIVDEALRLYPPFWMIDRIALEDDAVAGLDIPKGTMVIPYIFGTHRNPAYWDDADVFDPRRFDSAHVKARHPFAYIPFGGGPRTCIGNNMAMMQILTIVSALVQRYDFAPASPEPVARRPMMLLRPAGAVALSFRALP